MAIDWTGVAAVVTIVGGLFAIYRVWHARRRLQLTLAGAFTPDPRDLTTDARIRIYNPTSTPIRIEGAGFRLKSGTRIEYDNNAPGHSGTQRLPYRLEAHDAMTLSMDILLLIPQATGGEDLVNAYVDWAGGRPATAKVPVDWMDRWAAANSNQPPPIASGGQ